MAAVNELIHKAKYEYPYIDIGYNFDDHFLHFHEETEVLYVYEGSIIADIDSENHILKEGDICIILPSQIHTLIPIGYIKIRVMKLYPVINLINIRLKKNIYTPDDEHYNFLLENINRIVNEDSVKLPGYELSVVTACGNIMLYILRDLPQEESADISLKRLEYSTNFINDVNAYLEANYKSQITLEEIASSFNYSRSYFSRLFKEITGTNFIDYLNIFKLKKSIQLLKNTNTSIEDIAFSSGFNNLRSYNRSFSRHFGQSPGHYRKQFNK